VISGKRRAFLAALTISAGNLSAAAAAAGVRRKSHYDWLKDEDYRREFEQAQLEAAQTLEDEAIRRAVEGVERPLVHRGRIVQVPVLDAEGKPIYEDEPLLNDDGTVALTSRGQPKMQRVVKMQPLMEREYSDSLMQTLLRGAMPHKYGRHELTGPGGGAIRERIEIEFVDAHDGRAISPGT
jgi:hypothetical protein